MKVQKTPLKTRPIVSCAGSFLYALGVWVDDKLQVYAKQQKSYFKSSFDLKQALTVLDLPETALLFTSDAISMYTNIPTTIALNVISDYLRRCGSRFSAVPAGTLIEALKLVMTNNIIQFGDTHRRQKTGAAMGTPPAPPYATLYYALCENIFLEDMRQISSSTVASSMMFLEFGSRPTIMPHMMPPSLMRLQPA
jgi:hypothetical protein